MQLVFMRNDYSEVKREWKDAVALEERSWSPILLYVFSCALFLLGLCCIPVLCSDFQTSLASIGHDISVATMNMKIKSDNPLFCM